ncbi:MAG: tRNA preQ1(34) S-adenosylmethionine ribosyltransferase-isomerase QueA [Clostridia bacterium]|nr:tRNA preQ1(34) S-adenosylmethionine ribosyltransferase-isomerase QueA [Clostridia bacterium]
MKKSDFYFDLPEELIAQTPLEQRDHSRMLVIGKHSQQLEHKHFYDILEYLHPGDCLVLNNSRVLPARMYGKRTDTGAIVEFLLLHNHGNDEWEVITGPGKKAKQGTSFVFGDGQLTCDVLSVLDNGNRMAKFHYDGNSFYAVIDQIGEMPLPHYIHERLENAERYQTVYSKEKGSAAAPTAGLHFTPDLLKKIEDKGISVAYITLHVGIGTFRPVKTENIEDHEMHYEHFTVSEDAADKINECKKRGGRVVAVGTTCTRTLESVADADGNISACSDKTNIFIYPGYSFKCVDALITNFHLPESTLIMLVSAFCGRENALHAYDTAIKEKYRFFSFGDVCFISDSI